MFRSIPPVILNLLILNVLVFIGQQLVQSKMGESVASQVFTLHKSNALGIHESKVVKGKKVFAYRHESGQLVEERIRTPEGTRYLRADRFRFYQIVTHFFSHGGFLHIAINLFVLVSLGANIERVYGAKRFLEMYLFSGVVGGLMVAFLDPSPMPVVGASGAIAGVAVQLALLFPDARLMIIPIPIPIKAWKLILGVGVISLGMVIYTAVDPTGGGGVSHFGHLAGMVASLIWYYGRGVVNKNLRK